MVTSGLESLELVTTESPVVLHGSGIARPIYFMYDTSRTTHYSNVDTLYHSDDLMISISEFAHGREGCAKGRTYLGCGPFFASSFPHAATLLLHSAFCFDTRIASGACLLPFLSFYLLALDRVSHLVDPFIPLQYPRCRDRNKNNCCFSAFFPLHDQSFLFLTSSNYSHLTCFSRGMYCFPHGTARATPKRRSF
jgi:hypothetical protein